jgi:putative glutamine amidotransferase
MKVLAVSQRVDIYDTRNERRDALDQNWQLLLHQAGFLALLLPNQPDIAVELLQRFQPTGLLLTGGNSLDSCGGHAPERELTELAALRWALEYQRPVLGVCRGMQLLQAYFGQSFTKVDGHVCKELPAIVDGSARIINSYHEFGTVEHTSHWHCFAKAQDGVIKGIKHQSLPWTGIMWHPERVSPFHLADIQLFNKVFC